MEIVDGIFLTDLPSDCSAKAQQFELAMQGAARKVRGKSEKLYQTDSIHRGVVEFERSAFALLVRTILCKAGVKGQPTSEIGHKISPIATFMQGATCTRNLILDGYHSKAAAALKQDIEILVRISEVEAHAVKTGVTPQMRHAPTGSAKIYGELNKVAHPSNEGLLNRHLHRINSGDIPGVSPFASFVEGTIKGHFWTYAWLTYAFARESVKVLMDNYGEDDEMVEDCVNRFVALQDEGLRQHVLKTVSGRTTPQL